MKNNEQHPIDFAAAGIVFGAWLAIIGRFSLGVAGWPDVVLALGLLTAKAFQTFSEQLLNRSFDFHNQVSRLETEHAETIAKLGDVFSAQIKELQSKVSTLSLHAGLKRPGQVS